MDSRKVETNKRIHLKQSISISGLGTDTFNDAITSLYLLQTALTAHIPPQSLIPWAPSFFQDFPSIDISNRYFSKKKDALEAPIPFGLDVDPHGLLAHLIQGDLAHTSDNEVLYYQRIIESSPEDWRYVHFQFIILLCILKTILLITQI